MFEFKIQSGKPISLELVKMIMDILREAHCPQQVFKDNVPDYKSFDGYTIQLDEGDIYQQFIICKALFKEDELIGL